MNNQNETQREKALIHAVKSKRANDIEKLAMDIYVDLILTEFRHCGEREIQTNIVKVSIGAAKTFFEVLDNEN